MENYLGRSRSLGVYDYLNWVVSGEGLLGFKVEE